MSRAPRSRVARLSAFELYGCNADSAATVARVLACWSSLGDHTPVGVTYHRHAHAATVLAERVEIIQADGEPPAARILTPRTVAHDRPTATLGDLRAHWSQLAPHTPVLVGYSEYEAYWVQAARITLTPDGLTVADVYAPWAKQSRPPPGTVYHPAAVVVPALQVCQACEYARRLSNHAVVTPTVPGASP